TRAQRQEQRHRRKVRRREAHRTSQDERTKRKAELKAQHRPQPLRRKLQQSSYINKRQLESDVANEIRLKFGLNPTILLGNWSGNRLRGWAPTPGIGLRRMLIKHGFRVILVDEYLTSTMCPYCETGRLEKFLDVENPRLHRRDVQPAVTSHALLRCTSVNCIGRVADDNTNLLRARCLSRDLAAAKTFLLIESGLEQNGVAPEQFRRGRRAGGGEAAAPEGPCPASTDRVVG
ncbi:hypothetical protein GGI11_008738, partial [Coemansia sp. RSA 2049]